MNQKEFAYYVEEHIKDFLSNKEQENCIVFVRPYRKMNDVVRMGLTIFQKDEKVSAVIYLENAWKEYQEGKSMDQIVANLAEIYRERREVTIPNLSVEYEEIKDKIVSVVVGKEANVNNLKSWLYTDLGCDLIETYVIRQDSAIPGVRAGITITRDMATTQGYRLEDIREAARENTPRIFPVQIDNLAQLACNLSGIQSSQVAEKIPDILVVSNCTRELGVSALFYPGIQKQLAERVKGNYYVFPSSLHEVIIKPEQEDDKPQELETMVRYINQSSVRKEDFLSDKVMYYDREKEQLRLAVPDERQQRKEREGGREER